MKFVLSVFISLLLLWPVKVKATAKSYTRLDELNDNVEQLVQNKEYAEALSFCNTELQKSHPVTIKRFLSVTKARIFAKQKLFLDSIPIVLKIFEPVINPTDSLDLFLNARSIEILGHYYFLSRNLDRSIQSLISADSAYALTNNYAFRVYNLNMLGTIYRFNDNLSSALLSLLQANQLLLEYIPNDSTQLIDINIDIGLVYFNLKQYEKALEYYSSLMKMKLTELQKAQVLNNIGIINSEQGKYDIALVHFKASLKAFTFIEKLDFLPGLYNNIGSALEYLGAPSDSILFYYNKSLTLKKESNDSAGMIASYLNLSSFYFKNNNSAQAEKCLAEAFVLQKFFGAQDYATYYYLTSLIFEEKGLYPSALKAYKLYFSYQDTLSQIKNVWQLKKVETEIELQKRKQQIELLEKERALKIAESSKQKLLLYLSFGVTAIIIIILVFITYWFYRKQRYEAKLRSREVRLTSIKSLVKGQEDERLRIAKELHDGVGNNLAIIKAEILSNRAEDNQERILSLVSQTSEEVRSITHDLMPISVKKLGLKEAVNDLIEKWTHSSKLIIDANVENQSLKIDKNSELTIYRIIQECIKNAVEHGKASYILLNIKQKGDEILMQIEDNGIGLSKATSTDNSGIGHKNISNRVAFLNGTYTVNSDSNGTRISFVFNKPLNENTNS